MLWGKKKGGNKNAHWFKKDYQKRHRSITKDYFCLLVLIHNTRLNKPNTAGFLLLLYVHLHFCLHLAIYEQHSHPHLNKPPPDCDWKQNQQRKTQGPMTTSYIKYIRLVIYRKIWYGKKKIIWIFVCNTNFSCMWTKPERQ